jgi:hypothetical protein
MASKKNNIDFFEAIKDGSLYLCNQPFFDLHPGLTFNGVQQHDHPLGGIHFIQENPMQAGQGAVRNPDRLSGTERGRFPVGKIRIGPGPDEVDDGLIDRPGVTIVVPHQPSDPPGIANGLGIPGRIDFYKYIPRKKIFHHHPRFGPKVSASLNFRTEGLDFRQILQQVTDSVFLGRFNVYTVPCLHQLISAEVGETIGSNIYYTVSLFHQSGNNSQPD